MLKHKKTVLTLLLILIVGFASAQSKSISGVVVNDKGEAIVGANIIVKGSTKGVSTDAKGLFKIEAPAGSTLVVSFLGYSSKELAAKELAATQPIRVTLIEDTQKLDDVVVIGYGTMMKKDFTGSVGKVDVNDLQKSNAASYTDALAGRVAGVQVTSLSGKPGDAVDIVIRGGNSLTQSNAPLYVIDGFPMPEDYNNTLSPIDIASLDVLKDASATAIYGARGANGVIMITTKKGAKEKPRVTYEGSYGFSRATKKMEVLSPYEFALLSKELAFWDTTNQFAETYLFGAVGKTPEDYRNVETIDWQDMLLRDAAFQNHALTLTGGTDQTQYRVSGTYVDQQGIVIASGFERYTGNFSLDQTLTKKIKIGFAGNYSKSVTAGTPPNITTHSTRAIFYEVWSLRPFNLNGGDMLNEDFDPLIDDAMDRRFNPIRSANNKLYDNTVTTVRGSAYLEYLILPELKLRLSGSLDNRKEKFESFNSSNTREGHPAFSSGPNGSITTWDIFNWNTENTLTYSKTFRKVHSLNAVAGFTAAGNKKENYVFGARMLPTESLGLSGLDEGIPREIVAGSGRWTMASFLGRVNYGYKSRYLFTASIRADASSKFPKNNRWGYFPSAAVAWNIGEEKFMQRRRMSRIFSKAKVRASWGLTGNNGIGDFDYMDRITMNQAGRQMLYTFGGNPNLIGSKVDGITNFNLKWETTEQADLGLELGFLKNKILLEVDLYRKTTRDLLLKKELPYSTGHSDVKMNVGSIRNQGVEISLNTVNIQTPNFRWTSNFNISFNRNKILKFNGQENILTSTFTWSGQNIDQIPAYIAQVGRGASMMYGYVYDGLYQIEDFNFDGTKYTLRPELPGNTQPRANIQPGFIKYKDLNGDGEVDADDRTIIGDATPLHYGGFNNNFRYKGFDLGIFLQWSYGNDIMNGNNYIMESAYRVNTNYFASVKNRWTPTNTNTDIPAAHAMYGHEAYSSWFVEDGSFLRLKSIQLSYSLPQKWIKRVVSSVKLNVTASNVYTWTSYSGYDPEVSSQHSNLTSGFDYSSYPRPFTLTVGAKITF